jgi:cytochrome c oxidase subunit III
MPNPTLHDLRRPGDGGAGEGEHALHHPFLQHHFEDLGQQHEASTLGMWFFIAQEILFFGGLFCTYFVYREMFPAAWKAGSHLQNWRIGAANTIILIASSLTMALAVWSAQGAKRKLTTAMLILTLVLGTAFVSVKGYEYSAHFHEGLFPGANFTYVQEKTPELTPGVELFMTFYFAMTGLHALHMIIGAGLLLYFIRRAWRGDFGPEYYSPIEIMGLYWHFVDIIWIFLFPLLYLV